MKTLFTFQYVIFYVLTFVSTEVWSMGVGGGANQKLKCGAGYRESYLREGRTYRPVCVVDTVEMSKPEYNRESRRPIIQPTPPPVTKPKAAPAPQRPAQTPSNPPSTQSAGSEDHDDEGSETVGETEVSEGAPSPAQAENPSSMCGEGSVDTGSQCTAPAARSILDEFTDGRPATPNSVCSGGRESYLETEIDVDASQNYTVTPNGRVNADGVRYVCLEPKSKDADGGSCYTQFQQFMQKCLVTADEATNSCDQENETIQQAMSATKAVGVGSVALNQACSKLADISKIANTAFAGWQSVCAASQETCESSCNKARTLYLQAGCLTPEIKTSLTTEYKEIRDKISMCVSFKQRVSEAAQHAATALAQMQAAKKCESDTSSGLTSNNLDSCKKNPESPACKDLQRCSNAEYAASNPVCKCMNSPNAKECVAEYNTNGPRNVAGGGVPTSGGNGSGDGGPSNINVDAKPGADPFGDFANALRDGAQKGDGQNLGGQKGNASLGGGAGGGAGGGSGSGNGGSGYGGPGNPADPSDKTKLNSGFYGGGPAGAAGAGNFRNNSFGGKFNSRSNTGGVQYDKVHGGHFDPKRYIVGMNGKDGELINGPNGIIFKIVKTRIEAKSPTMLDPEFKK